MARQRHISAQVQSRIANHAKNAKLGRAGQTAKATEASLAATRLRLMERFGIEESMPDYEQRMADAWACHWLEFSAKGAEASAVKRERQRKQRANRARRALAGATQ